MIVNLELTFATGEARWRPAATGLLMAWNVSSARMQSWLKRSTASSRRLPAKPVPRNCGRLCSDQNYDRRVFAPPATGGSMVCGATKGIAGAVSAAMSSGSSR